MDKLRVTLEIIEKLESIKSDDPDAYSMALDLIAQLPVMPLFIATIKPTNVFYRTRPNNGVDSFSHISEVGITPAKYVSSYGRCNKPNESVFYCSENRPTSYIELAQSIAEKNGVGTTFDLTIIGWEIIKPIDVLIVVSTDKKDRVSDQEKMHGEILDHILSQLKEDDKEAVLHFLNYIISKFKSPNGPFSNTYFITAAFSNFLLNQKADPISGILYPSVPFAGQGINLALSHQAWETMPMRPIRGLKDKFEINESGGLKNFKQVGQIEIKSIDSSGNIIWP